MSLNAKLMLREEDTGEAECVEDMMVAMGVVAIPRGSVG